MVRDWYSSRMTKTASNGWMRKTVRINRVPVLGIEVGGVLSKVLPERGQLLYLELILP